MDPERPAAAGPWAASWMGLLWAVGAFGLGTIAAVAHAWIGWPLAAAMLGMTGPRHRMAIALGLAGAYLTWSALEGTLAPPLAFEGPDYTALFGGPIVALVSVLALWLGGRAMPSTMPDSIAGSDLRRAGLTLLGGLGLVALAAAFVTTAVQVSVPSRRSFELTLPAGWTVLPGPPTSSYYDPTYGDHFTAVRGPSIPRIGSPPPDPVLGVTVIRTETNPLRCIREVQGWSTGGVPVYSWPVATSAPVDLGSGPAYRIARAEPSGGPARLYGWGVVRTRQVGLLSEALCYMVVVTTPSDARLSAQDADAIVASFRFR